MSRLRYDVLRVAVGAAVLSAVLWWTGTGPFLAGLRSLDLPTLALGAAIAVPTTVAGAWRWHLVSQGLGVAVAMRPAVASCYRAQLINATLPGGILGDVHRGVRHGRQAGDTGRGLRAVAWERTAGQVVLAAVALPVLVLLPSPVRPAVPEAVAVLLAVLLGLSLVLRRRSADAGTRAGRLLRAAREDVRRGLLTRAAWPGVVLASSVALAGHVATYLVAARAVGVAASPKVLLPLTLLVLLAAGLPTNVAGWGPREGMAAWSFGAAGIGAAEGVATATAYGAIVLVACLPGLVVLGRTSRG